MLAAIWSSVGSETPHHFGTVWANRDFITTCMLGRAKTIRKRRRRFALPTHSTGCWGLITSA